MVAAIRHERLGHLIKRSCSPFLSLSLWSLFFRSITLVQGGKRSRNQTLVSH